MQVAVNVHVQTQALYAQRPNMTLKNDNSTELDGNPIDDPICACKAARRLCLLSLCLHCWLLTCAVDAAESHHAKEADHIS